MDTGEFQGESKNCKTTSGSSSTIYCHWCHIDLSRASTITTLNGNLPVCDLCLMKANGQNQHSWVVPESMLKSSYKK